MKLLESLVKSIVPVKHHWYFRDSIFTYFVYKFWYILFHYSEYKKYAVNFDNSTPIIYVLCPDHPRPIGGIKYLYRYVDVLNKNGFQAAIVHQEFGFRCQWFENKIPVVYRPEIKFKPEDFVVIPENYGPNSADIAKGVKKVIINQNAFKAFELYSFNKDDLETPYNHQEVVSVFCISQHIHDFLKYVFPEKYVYRAHLGIDTNLFQYNSNKKRLISYMPRKCYYHVQQVINILKFRGALEGFDLQPIENMSESDVAQVLKESLIFLSFGEQEGFGLPAAESMACGCIVVGYHGIGGLEFFNDSFCYPIESTDTLAFAKTVEQVINEFRENPQAIFNKGKLASEHITSKYTKEQEENDIITFWKHFLNPQETQFQMDIHQVDRHQDMPKSETVLVEND